MTTILIIILVLFLLFGGGMSWRLWGGRGLGGSLVGMILIIVIVMWLMGDFRTAP